MFVVHLVGNIFEYGEPSDMRVHEFVVSRKVKLDKFPLKFCSTNLKSFLSLLLNSFVFNTTVFEIPDLRNEKKTSIVSIIFQVKNSRNF